MKNLFFIALAMLLFNVSQAQDFYLPVSTTSEIAKTAYHKAADAASNINFEVANKQFDIAIEADPNFFMAHVLRVYYSSGEEKATLIDKTLTLPTDNLTKAEQIVRQQLVVWDKDPKAEIGENMKALVAAYPNTPQAYEWATLHLGYSGEDVDAALKYGEKLAAMRPTFAPNYNALGYLYMGKKEMDKAKAAFEKYIELAPNESNPYDSMGEYYMMVEDYAKSAKYYDKAAAMGNEYSKEQAKKARAKMQ